jgi:cytochrome c-type biogenesis protein CcmH/NrfF
MNDTQQLLALILAAALGVVATLAILRKERRASSPRESPFAASTEGEKRCPKCGMGNLWTDNRCISCGGALPG